MASQFEIWIDGRKVETADAKVSVLDRGFLYGDSVFETLRTYDKKLFALDEHLARLRDSAERVYIELPLGNGELKALVRRAVLESSFSECYVRVMVTRGQAALGLDPRSAVQPCLVLILTQLHPPSEQQYLQGIRAVTFATGRIADHTSASGAKLGNYLVAVLAQKKASEAHAHEALIMNADGGILEGATSNVFWLMAGELKTVPTEAGILAGITRAHLLQVATELGWRLGYGIARRDELLQSEAVFISSSIREVLSIVAIDDQPIAEGGVSPRVLELHRAFRVHARSEALRSESA